MNERIEKLAEQATEEVMRNTPSFLVTNEMWKAKFAELIVKECAGISEQHNRNYYKSHGQIIADKIKQHFGVEE